MPKRHIGYTGEERVHPKNSTGLIGEEVQLAILQLWCLATENLPTKMLKTSEIKVC